MTGGKDRRSAPASPFVWAFAISQMAGWGVLYFSFSLLVGPMEAELGWSKTDLNGALTVGLPNVVGHGRVWQKVWGFSCALGCS